jgi:hypothetical protein
MVADRPSWAYPDFDGVVRTIAHRGSTIYVGGDFDSVTDRNRTYTRHGVAAVDARTGLVLAWNPNVSGRVFVVEPSRAGVYLGGQFSAVKGEPRRNLARVSLGGRARLHSMRTRTDKAVHAIALSRSRVFIGGQFGRVNGKSRSRLAAFSPRAPFGLSRAWTPRARDGQVRDLVRTRAGVYVAGYFRELNGSSRHRFLALLTKKRGAVVRSFDPVIGKPVLDVATTKRRVYAAVGGAGGGGAAAFARSDGDGIFNRRFDGDAGAITFLGGQVYVGGHFSEICHDRRQTDNGDCLGGSTTRRRGASLTPDGRIGGWNPQLNGRLGVVALDRYKAGERLLAGGDFTQANGGARSAPRFAVFD